MGDIPITLSDFRSRLSDAPPAYQQYASTPEGRRQFLNLLIREKLLLSGGRKAGLQNDENYRKAVANYKRKWERELSDYQDSLLIQMYLSRLRSNQISVTDADSRQYYDAHIADYQHPVEYQVSHILVSSPEAAEQALARLKQGQPFEMVARTMSMDPATAVRGGKLAPFTKGSLMPEFENAAIPLKVGQVSEVTKTSFGYHLIKKTGQKPLPAKSYEQVKEDIQNRLQRDKFDQWVTQMQTSLGVKIDESALASVAIAPTPDGQSAASGAAPSTGEMESVR